MSDDLKVPLDDMALDSLEHAINTCITRDDDGNWIPVNGEYTLSQLLNFWSGYDQSKSVLLEGDGITEPKVYEYPHPVLHEHDVIRALVAEIRKLREDER